VSLLQFSVDVTLNGISYPAARDDSGGRQIATSYVPKVKSTRMNTVGEATLDPIEYTSFHRGAGASRNIGIQNMVAWGENIWTCDPGVLLPGPEVTSVTLTGATASQPPRPDGISEADGHIFIAAGQYVWKIANGQAISPTPTQDLDLTVGHQALGLRRFGSSLFLTQSGGTGALYERPDGGAWTAALLGATVVAPTGALGRVWWTTGGVTAERLVAQFGPRGIRYCSSSPRLDTSWTPGLGSPAIDVGGNGTITRFVTTLTHLYIAGTAGLLDLDQTGMAPNLIPEAELNIFPTGGLAAVAADGFIFSSAGYNLHRVDVTGTSYANVETVTPMADLPNETPVAGYGTAILKRGKYLIYAQYDAINDTSWISWGRDISSAETRSLFLQTGQTVTPQQFGPIAWNVAPIVIHGFKVTALHISGLASDGPRLWMVGTTLGGSVSAKWAPLAYSTPYGDLQNGRARRFTQSSFVVLPAEDGGDDSIQKDIEEVVNENENLGAGNSVKISGRKETETAFTQLANFTSGPRSIQAVPSAYITSRPTFRIDLTGTPTSPPVMRRLGIRWLPNPDVREVRRYLLRVGRAEQYAGGQWSGYGAEESAANLKRLATGSTRASFTDEAGTPLNVRVLKLEGPTEAQVAESNDRVLVMGVTLSIFGGLPGPTFSFDAGVAYDSARSWA
jgi:hypothetical protein